MSARTAPTRAAPPTSAVFETDVPNRDVQRCAPCTHLSVRSRRGLAWPDAGGRRYPCTLMVASHAVHTSSTSAWARGHGGARSRSIVEDRSDRAARQANGVRPAGGLFMMTESL